jgi:hypothetical protein
MTNITCESASRVTGRSLRRRILIVVLFCGFSVLLAVLAVEVLGRLIFRPYADDTRFYPTYMHRILRAAPILAPYRKPGTYDTKLGYTLSANATWSETEPEFTFTVHTNSLGFRSRELEPHLADEYRVLLVGDSFFYGAAINDHETIAVQLEQIAAEDPERQRPLRVYCYARPGYCTWQEVLITEMYAPSVEPDQIILGFFDMNDPLGNALSEIDDQGNFAPDRAMIERFRVDLEEGLGPFRHSIIARIAAQHPPLSSHTYYKFALKPHYLAKNIACLRRFRDYCAEHSYQHAIVFQHTKDTLLGGWRKFLYDGVAFSKALTDFCDAEKIPRADMLDYFTTPEDFKRYFYFKDLHPNPAGARRTAEVMYERFIKKELHRPAGHSGAGS